MKKINLLVLGLTLILTQVMAREFGGSGIGGGYVFSMVNWCDDALVSLEESKADAIEKSFVMHDEPSALRSYYYGLTSAAELAKNSEASIHNSLTLRSITRGVRVAQILGANQLLNTESDVNSRLLEIKNLNLFLDWYYGHISMTANVVDKNYYIPYSYYRSREDVTERYSTLVLEEKFVQVTTSLLTSYRDAFLQKRSAGDAYYPRLETKYFLMGLAFFTSEASKDLQESLFSEVYSCQSKKLASLSRKVVNYLGSRVSASEDPRKISGFAIELNNIVHQIEQKTCHK